MKLKYFYKINHQKQPIPGSNVRRKSKPKPLSQWKEITKLCCNPPEIDCTCGPRFWVQVDGANKPVDGTLIKRDKYPLMSDGIKYQEIEWKSPCCVLPGDILVLGFGGDDPCIGGTATFYIDTPLLEIGTTLYQEDQLTPVTFNQFRYDATGVIYQVTDGIVTGISETECSQIVQVVNSSALSDNLVITGVTVDDVAIIHTGSDNFPMSEEQNGQFKTTGFAPGLRTVKITITGTALTTTELAIVDSETNLQVLPYTGPGVYTFTNVFISGPNLITAGTGISLSSL
jgi:hypothetical protein